MDLFDELDAVWLVGSCAMKNSTTTFFPRILTVSYDNNTQNNLNSKKD